MKENPSFFAVIPATVRYDKRLSANAKMLYGEITALCNREGYCWAGNQYFAGLYGTTTSSIKRWIKNLFDNGYVSLDYRYVEGTKEIQSRLIKIVDGKIAGGFKNKSAPRPDECPDPYADKTADDTPNMAAQAGGVKNEPACLLDGGGDAAEEAGDGSQNEQDRDEETRNEFSDRQTGDAPERGGGRKNEPTWVHFCAGAGSFLHGGGVKNEPDINTINNNNNIITSSSSKNPEKKNEEEDVIKIKELREELLKTDKSLIFTDSFYPAALAFLEKTQTQSDYLIWLYNYCGKQKPRNLTNYYYKLFFSGQMIELYRQEKKPPDAPEAEYQTCPVCGESMLKGEKRCPHCRFDVENQDDEKIQKAAEIYGRKAAEIAGLRKTETDTMAVIKGIAEINRRYENSA
jgi:hypothetical protein